MIPTEEVRLEIVEKIHNIMDLLRNCQDEITNYLCERILERMDVLAGMDMEDYE